VTLPEQLGEIARVEADAIVADPQPGHGVVRLVDRHRHVLGARVLGDIGQRLLDDAVQDRLQLRREAAR
jgi:hypothetical protein